jgi:hypothetical protein
MKKSLIASALLAAMVFATGCIGTMSATSRVKTWNREIENRWAGEGVYVLLRFPYGGVYGLLFLSDVLVFNAIEFWGGENPIGPVDPARIQRLRELDARRHGSGEGD